MIEENAISSGTIARNEREHEVEHEQRAEAADQRLDQDARALAAAAVLRQRVEAGQLHRLAGDGSPRARRVAAFSASGFSPNAEFGSGGG